jgi:hypothetical protein
MKYELTKKEAHIIHEMLNHYQNLGLDRLRKQLETIKNLDSKDKGSRMDMWLDESCEEWDIVQTIKAKMYAVIKEVNNDG